MMVTELFEIQKCEVCGNLDLKEVLDLGLHPMCDDLVHQTDNRICKEYPIVINFCSRCYTAHQKYQIPKTELFPKSYHYRSRFTADVLNGMKTLIQDCKRYIPDFNKKKVIDIGCNDGSLLDFFKQEGAITAGIEPTNAGLEAMDKGHYIFNDFLSIDSAKKMVEERGQFDVITFTNVFAHIENLEEVIDALKIIKKKSTIIIIENHYLGSVLDRNQFDTFYHEHPRTYSYTSFLYIAKSLELDIINVEFPSRYGGNIRVIIGDKHLYPEVNFDANELAENESYFEERFKKIREEIVLWKEKKTNQLKNLVQKYGPLKAKAFPGRAAILVKLLNLDNSIISSTYEKPGSMKIGNYIPGTRIIILSDDELFKTLESENVIVNLAWHISDEIETYLRSNGFKGEIVNIL